MLAVVVATAQAHPKPARAAGAFGLVCLGNPETREAMQAQKAIPPFRAVAVALRDGGDLVAIRLCRSGDQSLVYDVSVLRRDGRLVHVLIDAGTGAPQPGRRLP